MSQRSHVYCAAVVGAGLLLAAVAYAVTVNHAGTRGAHGGTRGRSGGGLPRFSVPGPDGAAQAGAVTVERMPELPRFARSSLRGAAGPFHKLYSVDERVGRVVIPETFADKVKQMFKAYPGGSDSLHFVETQTVVTTFNRFTLEHSLFNEIRRFRPGYRESLTKAEEAETELRINATREGCDFCHAERTASDIFGKVRGKYCYIASNVAKYEKWHSLLIAHEHHPFRFTLPHIVDYVDTVRRWFKRVYEADPSAIYPHLMWDCMPRASASQMHQHMQINIVDHPLSKPAVMLHLAERYGVEQGANLWSDIVAAHLQVGLAVVHGNCALMAYITPIKERELVVAGPSDDECFPLLWYAALSALLRHGTRSYSSAIHFEPMDGRGPLPAVARVIDRGAPGDLRNDVGAMEFYGSNNVGQDPFRLMPWIHEQIEVMVAAGQLRRPE
eukprot:TRINITY_DN69977_c0_g1_i1.p1 TRINITY_DN69977_c0_g1~~TRINITY_DN69977_c0_g1_i1.p1  ORF type:complete len:494 (+),score=144.76 TRINITY_DN69977_c0_g1_i1:154-1482(+)